MHALRPAAIGSLQLKNCIVRAATSESLALETGEVTPELIAFHRALAEGGVGLSILGHAYVHHRGKSLAHQTGIHDDALVPGLKSLTTAVHDSGGVIFAQLAHAGSQSGVAPVPLAPSAVPNALTGRVPPAATLDEIHEAIQAFGDAARRAMEAGFDGVHIHAANGYLISEFSSPHANHRADEWGGSAEKRTHFLAAVYDAVRRETGPNVPVTVKLGMEDEVTNGLGLVESAAIVKALANRGIDGVEVSVGLMSAGSDSCRKYVAVDFNTFVVKGELHIYDLEGNTKEVRYPGTYTAGIANDEPHTEGGGQEDVVVLFSLRPYSNDKPIYEILDETGEIAAIMTFDALKELHEGTVEAPE